MRIMVFDVPASQGGALSILNDFYEEIVQHNNKDIEWIFVLSKPSLKETENVKVLRFPWIKKSWLHRIFFDQFIAPKLVKNVRPDKIFSLQNVIVPKVKVEQVVYVHQSLPFIDYRFNFSEDKILWINQNILNRFIFKSIRKSQKVLVQTNWIKKACVEKLGVNESKIVVIPPKVHLDIINHFEENEINRSTFFYPAAENFYKNHRLIVEACEQLVCSAGPRFEVIFTLKGDENDHIKALYNRVQEMKLPIQFIGKIKREKVFEYYSKSILIFPSYVETFGLPLLESRLHKGIIIAADTPFSHEILDGYPNAHYFNAFESGELIKLMKQLLDGELKYSSKLGPIDLNEKLLIENLIY